MSQSQYRFQPKGSDASQQNSTSFSSAFQGRNRRAPNDNQETSTQQNAFPSVFGGRERRQESSPQDYNRWKTKEQKSKPLTADDFPPLGSTNAVTASNPVIVPKGPSLAERLRVTIAKEEEEASSRRFRKEEEAQQESWGTATTLNLSKTHHSYAQKKREDEARRASEREAEEKNYDWQVSREIVQELEDDCPPYASTTDDEHEDMSCFPADDEDDTVRPTTPLYH